MIKKLYERLCAIEARLAATFLIVMVTLIFAGGLARLAGHPINWAIDLATCLFAWACFLCGDIAWRKDKLMSVDLLTSRLPARVQKSFRMLNYAVISVFMLYVMGAGLWLSYVSRARSFQGIPEVSYSWVTMSMPVGATLILITTLLKVRDELRARAAGGSAGSVLEETA